MNTKPILVTGASGQTGRKVVSALLARNAKVRAFVRRHEAGEDLKTYGPVEISLGDFEDHQTIATALSGIGVVVHICPPMAPNEDTLAKSLIELCQAAGVSRLVLYSVLHPIVANVPHHRRKLAAERALIESGLNYTILQPCRYMQHLGTIWNRVIESGVHAMPFSTHAKFSVVDLEDLAEATAIVASEPNHDHATYQLAGPEQLSQTDMAEIISKVTGKRVTAAVLDAELFASRLATSGMPEHRIATMTAMNQHYDAHGLAGNSNVLRYLLGREPTDFETYIRRDLHTG